MSPTTQHLRARWVLTAESAPLRDGLIEFANGRISYVGPDDGRANQVTQQECVILPGFINAHTHLEFSSLTEPLGQPSPSFTDWIRRVIAWRRARDQDERSSSVARRTAIEAGLAELRATGTCGVGEISQLSGIIEHASTPGLVGVRFLEFIGLHLERIPQWVDLARRYRLPESPSPMPTYHVRVRFPAAVRGPLAVGAGRYRGFGLFAVERME